MKISDILGGLAVTAAVVFLWSWASGSAPQLFLASGINLDSATEAQCVEYELPQHLSSLTDGDCMAIGILIEKAVSTSPAGCVVITNDWWHGADVIDAPYAKYLAAGY